MKFIKNVSDDNYADLSGQVLNPIINEIITAKRMQQIPDVQESEIILMEDHLINTLGNIGDIYLKPGLRKEKITGIPESTCQSTYQNASYLSASSSSGHHSTVVGSQQQYQPQQGYQMYQPQQIHQPPP